MDWYVIQAYSGYEQKVKAALQERITLNNLSDDALSKLSWKFFFNASGRRATTDVRISDIIFNNSASS